MLALFTSCRRALSTLLSVAAVVSLAAGCGGPQADVGRSALTPFSVYAPCSNTGSSGATSTPCPSYGSAAAFTPPSMTFAQPVTSAQPSSSASASPSTPPTTPQTN